ncbi:16S rRNA (guanine(966)-N(2))-methyltransferase RsmD [Oscillatoria sp. FACHB-1406]|uniref:16S rRNA (guanine(966)-N(2))-methyltransferase RsmD n=1 Tax=Oscillatoria sp. FACHB-1406 TaxID=2692846 RepID=UPI0016859707|nr:16S rRNA (guanine(966)-N(2))-methyltransferase RsmD [Oscillatoria sp. FACHB-1406]MBD2577844.1 16S rRNA (guanine(966)-N(2))-methyltransferase RsmD [Oscillatoria sp. FACHB-1406]
MRIYGNRLLKTLPGQATRPTSARVREAVFNIWQGDIEGCRWLDLCAGNGSMGAEALCRGADRVVGIEQSGRAISIIRQNWQGIIRPGQSMGVLRGDVRQKLNDLAGEQFDRIYFDPPYRSDLYEAVPCAIARLQLLCDTGELAIEHDPKLWKAVEIAGLERVRHKVYGNTAIAFYQIAQ